MNVNTLVKRLNVSKKKLSQMLDVNPGTVYVWDDIPSKHMEKVHRLLADSANGNLPMVIDGPKGKNAVVFEEVKVHRSSKVAIAIMDAEEAQEFLNNFMSGNVG